VTRPSATGAQPRGRDKRSIAEARRLVQRALRRYAEDDMVDRGPAIAYYGILSLFPLLLIGFSVVRLIAGADAPDDIASYAQHEGASGAVADAFRSAAQTARAASPPTASAAGLAGVLTLVYGGSRAFTATGRALDIIARAPSIVRSPARRAQDVAWTLVVLVMVIAFLVFAVAGGRALEQALELVGVDGQLSVWSIVRWPAAAVTALLIVALVRWAALSGDRPPFRLATPGVLVSVVVLIVASVGFDIYVSNFASYNSTYGAFAGGVIVLLWIWLAAVALLLGAELDAARGETGITPSG
jgi:membrane protein